MTILARLVNHDMLCGFERPRGAGGAGSASTVGLDRAGTGTEQHPMTNQHTQRKRTVTGIALAALLFSGMLVFNGVLAAQTAEEPQVVFRVRMVQAERAALAQMQDPAETHARLSSLPMQHATRQ